VILIFSVIVFNLIFPINGKLVILIFSLRAIVFSSQISYRVSPISSLGDNYKSLVNLMIFIYHSPVRARVTIFGYL